MQGRSFFLLLSILSLGQFCTAQKKDSIRTHSVSRDSAHAQTAAVDTFIKKKHDPKKATFRSAVIPGWGQAYNRKYWKIPIVYAALGITGYIFNYNRVQYNKVKYAYFAVINRGNADSVFFPVANVSPDLKGFVDANDSYSLQLYRNTFRKDIDYSVLFFLFFWALNVVDATVDGHLKDFDISNNLTLQLKPEVIPMTNAMSMSLVFNIGKHPTHRSLPVIP